MRHDYVTIYAGIHVLGNIEVDIVAKSDVMLQERSQTDKE